MNKEKGYYKKKKRGKTRELKVYFLILNLIIAVIAMSYLVSAETKTFDDSYLRAIVNFFAGSSSPKKDTSTTPVKTGGSGTSSSPAAALPKEDSSAVGETKIPAQTIGQRGNGVEFLDWFFNKNNNRVGPKVKEKMSSEQYNGLYALANSGATPVQLNNLIIENAAKTQEWKDNLNGFWTGGPMRADLEKINKKANEMTAPGDISNPPKNFESSEISKMPTTITGAVSNYFENLLENLKVAAFGAVIGGAIGTFAGGKNGWFWGGLSGGAGAVTYQILKSMGRGGLVSALIGLGVAAAIFLLTYKKDVKELVEFNCLPWQAPIGGADCGRCNDYKECGEYTCKSLGQACELVNKGTQNQKCIWKNPYDTNSPTIEMKNVSSGHKFIPDKTIRPPATGVVISQNNNACIKAFFPLEFLFVTNEPAQCKIDYNLTSDSKTAFDDMGYYVGGIVDFSYNHSEKLSLPGPDAINKIAPELKNDGTYTLFIRCMDANGNFNVNPFSVKFCVEKGPDTTPPIIVNVNIPSRSPIQFNKSSLDIEVYVNEPSECKWSHEDRDYNNMEYNMSCDNQLWEMNNEETYTCRTKLTGIESRKENVFYFRCKDKPDFEENERNVDKQSYRYVVIGTQPLNIIKMIPEGIVKGATERIPVNLSIITDNGYNNGEALCYYSATGNESNYIEFSETGGNEHKQRQDLTPGNYVYYFKCLDLGGNTAYNFTNFIVESDTNMPIIIRVYKESGELKIITDKESECSYSYKDCNFEIDDGIKMSSINKINHYVDWVEGKNYYVRCKDKNNNQPDPNVCSAILNPINLYSKVGVIEL